MSQQQAQIETLEALVLALVGNAKRNGRDLDGLFDDARAALMKDDAGNGHDLKTQSTKYLDQLKERIR